MTAKEKQQFKKRVRAHYKSHGRHTLPWRKRCTPYRIVVSEIMLQQTQVDRVLPKYKEFIKRWPTARALARASLAEVLTAWQGLGYNRRAKLLHQCVRHVTNECGGRWPTTYTALMELPGIGPYTAGAVMAFAYNQAVPILETNIKTVYLHHFFKDATDVSDKELLALVTETLDTKDPQSWYWALMDYGAYLKRTHGNPNSRSASYTKQSAFVGSDRQIRGAIVRRLTISPATRAQLLTELPFTDIRIDVQLERLLLEEMIVQKRGQYQLPQ